jgi:hypothetical protein
MRRHPAVPFKALLLDIRSSWQPKWRNDVDPLPLKYQHCDRLERARRHLNLYPSYSCSYLVRSRYLQHLGSCIGVKWPLAGR